MNLHKVMTAGLLFMWVTPDVLAGVRMLHPFVLPESVSFSLTISVHILVLHMCVVAEF